MKILALVFLSSMVSIAGETPSRVDFWWLCYDDGTPAWTNWAGAYRGVWFDLEDFIPSATGYCISMSEIWFSHEISYPWDTSQTLVEIWNGDPAAGFTELLSSTQLTAVHLSPVFADYDPPIEIVEYFWYLQNTELSSGGWPSIVSDQGSESPSWGNSYHTDGTTLVPCMHGSNYCNYFIRILGWPPVSFKETSWGSIKTVF